MAICKRWRRKVLSCSGMPLERLSCRTGQGTPLAVEGAKGCPFYLWKGLVVRLKRAPHMGCMMPSVGGMRENRLQWASVELLGLPEACR